MTTKRICAVIGLALIVCLFLTLFPEPVHAQLGADDSAEAKSSDKKVATRRGVSGALADGPAEESEGPSKVQMAIGLGSFVVMIAVVKWL